MAAFDKAFIPVLVHLYKNDMVKAERSIFYLDFKWNYFKTKYENHVEIKDLDLVQIEHSLAKAYKAINAYNRQEAIYRMNDVQAELSDWRAFHGVDYYPDYLFDFQLHLDYVLEVTQDDYICKMEWQDYENLVLSTRDYGLCVVEKTPDPAVFVMTKNEVFTIEFNRLLMTRQLNDLEDLLENADRLELLGAALKLQHTYLAIYGGFGDFNISKPQYVNIY